MASTGAGYAGIACHACGKEHDNASWKLLPDGRRVGSQSEAWRLWCEAQWAMRLPDKVGPRSKRWTKQRYLLEVGRVRGEDAAAELRGVMVKLWKEKTHVSRADQLERGEPTDTGSR